MKIQVNAKIERRHLKKMNGEAGRSGVAPNIILNLALASWFSLPKSERKKLITGQTNKP